MDRRKALSLIHIARKDLALDDGTYRALLERVTKHRSAADCGDAQLMTVLDEFKRLGWQPVSKAKRSGATPCHNSPLAGKIRALRRSLYYLGELRDSSEQALAHFVDHTTGVARLEWLTPKHADQAIDALKGWCKRVGFVEPDAARLRAINFGRRGAGLAEASGGHAAKITLVERQWELLIELGAMRYGGFANIGTFLMRNHGCSAARWLDAANADRCIERLGAWIRTTKSNSKSNNGSDSRGHVDRPSEPSPAASGPPVGDNPKPDTSTPNSDSGAL
ncbi:MAG TPA: regulatory protein GemA [Stellaceae bacterium]